MCHKIFYHYVFHDSNPSGPLINRVKYFRIRFDDPCDFFLYKNLPICWIPKNIPDRQKCVGFQKRKKYQIITSYCVCWSRQENTQPAGNIFFFWQRILFINPHYLSWLNSCPQTRAISHVLIREAKSRTTQTQMLNINYVDDFKPTKAWNNFLAQTNWNICDVIFSLPKHGFLGFFFTVYIYFMNNLCQFFYSVHIA